VSADARAVHLLCAGEAFRQRFPSTLVALCGEPVASEPDIEDDHRYCADCVSAAIQCGQGLDDPCPRCGATSDVKAIPDTSPKAPAWKCSACGME
jgi:hypothetical protein